MSNHSIYFVEKGIVELIAFCHKKNEPATTIKRFYQGDSFGELDFLTECGINYSIKFIGHTKLSFLKKKSFLESLQSFPEDYVNFLLI